MTLSANPIDDERLGKLARAFEYPATPDISRKVRARLVIVRVPQRIIALRAIAIALVVLIAALIAIPQTRANIVRFFQVGVIRILPVTPTPTNTPLATPVGTSTPTPNLPALLRPLVGETTLEQARPATGFPILLPTYPSDLGQPDYVFLQPDGPLVILIWMDKSQPDQVRLSLEEIYPGATTLMKFKPRIVQETQVNGQYAIWTEGPHLLQVKSYGFDALTLVEGNTLIWVEDTITYRIESSLALDEVLQIAESLK